MSEANTSAPAGTGDDDLSFDDAMAQVPDDAFDEAEDSPAEHTEAPAEPAPEETPAEPETGEEPAAEPAPEETPAEPEEPAEAPQGPQTVTIGGKAIPLAEVEAGYQRQADYTRKTQEVAAERRALVTERETVTSERTQLASILDLATDLVKAHLPPEADPKLIDTDAILYLQQDRAHKAGLAELNRLAEARRTVDASSAQERQTADERAAGAQREADAAEYRTLQSKVPEIRTAAGHEAFFKRAAAAGTHYGYTPQEVLGTRDHRAILVLQDAMKWRDMQAKVPAAVQRAQAAPPIRPAARQAPGTRGTAAVEAARARLAREGSIEAAADLLDDALFD